MPFVRRVILANFFQRMVKILNKEIFVMDETNAFISGRTTLKTNIMNDRNKKKKKIVHTIICSIVNKRSDGNKYSFISLEKGR